MSERVKQLESVKASIERELVKLLGDNRQNQIPDITLLTKLVTDMVQAYDLPHIYKCFSCGKQIQADTEAHCFIECHTARLVINGEMTVTPFDDDKLVYCTGCLLVKGLHQSIIPTLGVGSGMMSFDNDKSG